jgi:hypothetical protein
MLRLTDVRPCFLCERMWGNHRTYALQIVHGHTWDHMDICYFLKYPLDNTWTYDAPFGPLHKLYRTYARVGRRSLFFQS